MVTVRKTAWKKALLELQWFFSGNPKCPDELLNWWDGQLDKFNCYLSGYSDQFRFFNNYSSDLDQVQFILSEIKQNPNSRRMVMTVWNSADMIAITEKNKNPNTPACCHSTVIQFFVRNGELHIKTYQRSADMLLGVPHNWIQAWAMLLYFAYHSSLSVGTMTWIPGDAHIYNENHHIECAKEIIIKNAPPCYAKLIYHPESIEYDVNSIPVLKASDFSIEGDIPDPVVTIKPKRA